MRNMIENHRDHVVWIIRFTCDTAWLKHGMRTHGHTVENCILEKQADELSRYTNSLPDNVSHLHTLWNVPPLHVKVFNRKITWMKARKSFIRVCSPRFNLLFIVLRIMHKTRYFEIFFIYIYMYDLLFFVFFFFLLCERFWEKIRIISVEKYSN